MKAALSPKARLLGALLRFRLLQPRTVWLPTWRVLLAGLLLCSALLVWGTLNVYAFLAPTRPVANGEILVVEGWLPEDAMARAKDRFDEGEYRLIIASGGPIPRSSPLSLYLDYAQLCADRLARVGIDRAVIVPVAAPPARTDRTRESARTIRRWLDSNGYARTSVDLLSMGPHGRRTWRTFQEELPEHAVGIVSVPTEEYESSRWWVTSAGVRAVVGELLAYLHFELF